MQKNTEKALRKREDKRMVVLGKVVEDCKNGIIRAEILRTSACGGKCGSCGNSCGSKSYVKVKNKDGATVGDVVMIESSGKKVLWFSFSVFMIPLIVICCLYNACINNFGEILASLVAFFGGIAVFLGTVVFYRRLKMPESKLYYQKSKDLYMIDNENFGG